VEDMLGNNTKPALKGREPEGNRVGSVKNHQLSDARRKPLRAVDAGRGNRRELRNRSESPALPAEKIAQDDAHRKGNKLPVSRMKRVLHREGKEGCIGGSRIFVGGAAQP